MTLQNRNYTKNDLLDDMAAAEPFDEKERLDIRATIEFLRRDSNPFDRTNFAGHITGSGFLLSPDRQSVLLTHHAALDKWLQFGGHADGEADIRSVALRETEEESGKTDIKLFTPGIFDVDVHEIPDNPEKGEPRHLHYDIRYLLLARNMDFKVSHESKALQWVPFHDLSAMSVTQSLKRMAIKVRQI
ncbi:NUDIX hydrolase [Filomicrobium sp.]|uniref:NUDIX hydrolase n=1 Tax=Filomicrobium sp. TaxID=2024831 RepID=UPI0025827540|nr:NUDIX hydrolase [Filomicrobium sp.]MCV0371852.1 NUDIX hydrolase [Filomicrobium sp.]